MNYIKEVRVSLEKVRERMCGEFGGIQQKMQQLSQDIRKSLVDSSFERNDMRQEMRSLKESYENAVEKLKEKERQLEAALTENETLKLKVESSQEANSQVLQDMTRKLYNEYEDKLGEVQRIHRRELEALQIYTHGNMAFFVQKYLTTVKAVNYKRRFVQTLPDKGKKISDFVEKVRSALAHIEDVERTKDMLSTVKMEFESRFQTRSTIMEKEHGHNTIDISTSQTQLLKTFINSSKTESKYTKQNGDTLATAETISEYIDVHMPQNNCDTPADSLARVNMETATTTLLGQPVYGVKINSALKNDEELAQVFEKVTLADETEVMAGLDDTRQETVSIGDNRQNNNPFGINQPQKKPHYIEVFEKAEKNPAVRKSKFKPNQLPSGSRGSSSAGSSSPSHSPRRPESQLSPAERLLRDKKHLDDITAAKLPPLHHLPTQLLSMEESAALQQGQKKKYEEVQATVAAQKLAEKLNVRMVAFNPEGEAMVKYREVRDDGDIHSSEDD
ncbi:DNA-directed RNA polymerase II subunit GRINL1A [Acipenser ruthenus]|uniref:DNA-directed RNA polymerase II subunit GRINL1A n=1 Tax=Acipenser ruthenus TaxID=7906 RepID=A0A444UYC1_ACIRT|nr:DNA-directed RNA polymerase II subunit GRINL1A [Acipenser ruthenus]